MINLMIVDDEPMVVNIVRSQFDWTAMDIDHVYTANSFQQACALCEKYEIHLMICDIELLQESGLKLLEWMRDRGLDVVSIFLTGHDNFEYCQRALELGGLEYILKPAKYSVLEKGILHGVEKVKERQQASQYIAYGKKWLNNTPAIQMQFWSELFNGAIQPQESAVDTAAERYGVTWDKDERYSIVLLRSWFESGTDRKWDRSTLQYAVRQIVSETVGEPLVTPVVLPEQNLMAFIASENHHSLDQEDLSFLCRNAMDLCEKYLSLQADILLGGFCPAWQLAGQMETLVQLLQNTASVPGRVLLQTGRIKERFEPLPQEAWKDFLSYGQFSTLRCETAEYLRQQALDCDGVAVGAIFQFLREFTALLEVFLEGQGVPVQWMTEEEPRLYRQALRSLESCRRYTDWLLEKLPAHLQEASSKGDIVGKAKQYVKAHIMEDLSRDDIAQEVGVNAEYLSRLFKKREGRSLIEYIQTRKMQTAASLLQSGQPIGDVAKQLGYHNFAYFTQLFKKHTGETPSGFKKRLEK